MDSDTLLQNSVQTPPQEQAQTNPPSDRPSPATVPEGTGTRRPPPASDTDDIDARARKKLRKEELRALSQTFGNIPDVPIFTRWEKRIDCSNSAVHRSLMAGICGSSKYGAYSVALSSLYKDDEDGGDVIIYTGAGGRERWTNSIPPKRLRMGPQTKDQSWDASPNKALIVSFLTGNPLRVIRSWRCPSQYAPLEGYRYDGLYKVAAYWTAKGRNGKNICRCRLERLPDQPPIPVHPSTSTNPYDIPDETDVAIGPNQSNPSPAQLAVSTGRESEELPCPPQQRAMSETSTGIDVNMGEVGHDVQDPQPPSLQRRVSPNPGALPRYRWDPKKNKLVKLPASHPIPEYLDAAGEEEEEEHRGEDDATLVPSEDSHVDMPVNVRMETEYLSDMGGPDEPRASGSLVFGKQGDH